MTALPMTEPEVAIDDSCCWTWRRSDGIRTTCPRPSLWEIQRNGEPMAFACSTDLERMLALVYSYEADETALLHVVPIYDLSVKATVQAANVTATASLRPVPVGIGPVDRGDVIRDDRLPVPGT